MLDITSVVNTTITERGARDMIKCPNCGSTAQVKVFIGDNLNDIWAGSTGYVKQHLICGCGCEFIRQFILDDEYIINNEEGSE
jgi:hypothetical protein